MIENNDEAKRSKIWTVVTSVTSVLIIIVAIFLLMKMFTGNPLEGSWTDEDGNMNLKISRDGQMTVTIPASGEGKRYRSSDDIYDEQRIQDDFYTAGRCTDSENCRKVGWTVYNRDFKKCSTIHRNDI